MNPFEWGAADWGAFGQVGALLVAVVAGVLVWLQVRQGRQVREDQTRPYVTLDFEFEGWEVVIAIRNIGTTPARNVRFRFDKPLESPRREDGDEELAIFSSGIPMLAPGRRIAVPFGNGPDFFNQNDRTVPLMYTANVSYSDLEGRKMYADPPLVLDLLPFKHSIIDRDDLHQIYQQLKDIKAVMKSWTAGQRLRINTITQAEVDDQRRQMIEARTDRRQDIERRSTTEESADPGGDGAS